MPYIAVIEYDTNNRPTKFQEYADRANADAHVARHGGFVADHPGESWPHWRVDPVAQTVSVDVVIPPAAPVPPLSAEELYDMLERKGHLTPADRPRQKTT